MEVILDDRNDRPGVKFKDSELVGFPLRVGIGEKSLAKGEVELKQRGGTVISVKADDAVAKVMELLSANADNSRTEHAAPGPLINTLL